MEKQSHVWIKEKRVHIWIKKLTLACAALFLMAVSMLTVLRLLKNPGGYAFYENRYLAQPADLTAGTLLDGSYFQSLEPAFSDHFFWRDRWLKLYDRVQLWALQKTSVQNLVLTDEALLPVQTPVPVQSYEAQAEAMAESLLRLQTAVASYGGTFLFVGLPEQSTALQDWYPETYFSNETNHTLREEALFQAGRDAGVSMLDMTPLFAASDDPTHLYYRTDHHYRLEGAYFTYQTICETLQEQGVTIPVLQEGDFSWETLPNPFLGSRNKKLIGLLDFGETLSIYTLHDPIPFTREDNGSPVEAAVFSMPATDTEYVQYTNYMGGDVAETILRTNRPDLPNCLIFGDSFTNALETFLYTSFNETRSLDLRHYQDMGILEYLAEYQPDVVLLVQNDTVYLLQEGNGLIQ